jgi:hypothetical protein
MTPLHLAQALSSPRPDLVYLLTAALCLIAAVHFWKIALIPVATFVRAIAAALLVALAISVALVLLIMVALVS